MCLKAVGNSSSPDGLQLNVKETYRNDHCSFAVQTPSRIWKKWKQYPVRKWHVYNEVGDSAECSQTLIWVWQQMRMRSISLEGREMFVDEY